MTDAMKIGVIYRGQAPRIFRDTPPDANPWLLEFLPEEAVLNGPVAPRRGFLAVFVPCGEEGAGVPCALATVFPGAEIIGYIQDPEHGGVRTPGIPVLTFPMPYALAHQALESLAVAREQRRELVQARRRIDEVEEFYESTVNLVESTWNPADRKLGMNVLMNRILEHVRAEECIIYLVADEGTGLERAYVSGNIKDIDVFDYRANAALVERVLDSGAVHLDNNHAFELKVPFSKQSVFIRSVLCVPIELRGEKLGVIEVLNKSERGGFTADDQALVEWVVRPLAVALRNIAMFEGSERLTVTDDLTNLFNYRYLMQFLETEVKRCLRYKKKVSLLFVDVDGFKRINDTFGHLVGSQALAEIGQVLRRILRETDVVGRYGGDEFVIVLPETPLAGALVIAERIRKKVEDYPFAAQNLGIRLTVSLGVANCPKHTLTAEGLIKKADAAMYRAKERSKNSIKVAV
jgi:diguanylate cyclase (GGDEF)-like protein